jgi:hypothetical protein
MGRTCGTHLEGVHRFRDCRPCPLPPGGLTARLMAIRYQFGNEEHSHAGSGRLHSWRFIPMRSGNIRALSASAKACSLGLRIRFVGFDVLVARGFVYTSRKMTMRAR